MPDNLTEGMLMPGKKGFTLIELLVVIAIIALMLSVLVPALNQVKERGKRAVCMSNLRQLSMANILYAQMYNGRFVPVEVGGDWQKKALDGGGYDITLPDGDVIKPPYLLFTLNNAFIKLLDQNVLETSGYHLDSELNISYYGLPKKFRCPSYPSKKASVAMAAADGENILQTSYAPNMTDSMWSDVMFEEIWDKGVVVDEIKRPAAKILFTDAKDPAVTYANDKGNYVNHWDEHGEIVNWELQDPSGPEHGAEPMYRHSEGANVAFCDGHAEYLRKTEMFYFTDGNKPNLAATNVDVTRNDRLWCYFK